jgi:quercetin dioxygenase-like cupin family protein
VDPHARQVALLDVDEGEVLSDRAERTVRALFEHPLLDVTWSRYEAGERGPEPHVHWRHVDAFYVVEGELRFGVGPAVEQVRARAGTFVLVPPDVVHTFENASDSTARWLNFHAPSTGFVAHLRGEREGFDSHDPPTRGGRSAAEAIISPTGAGRSPQLAVSVTDLEGGFVLEPHADPGKVDSFFVLDGEVEFTVTGRAVRAGRDMWMSAPPGVQHGLRNPGLGGATLLHVTAPGGRSA